MCNYKYKDDTSKRCPFPKLFSWLKKRDEGVPEKLKPFPIKLLSDQTKHCIFHSRDYNYKLEYKANQRFRQLVSLCVWAINHKYTGLEYLAFEGFTFFGEKTDHAVLEEADIIDFSDMKIDKVISFKGANFENEVWFNSTHFGGTVSFEQCLFHGDAHFESAVFDRRVRFGRAAFTGSAGFRDTMFKSGAEFNAASFSGSTAFNQTVFHGFACFDRAIFSGETFFRTVSFVTDVNDNLVTFNGTSFESKLNIEGCLFYGETVFNQTRFDVADFIDVEFSSKRPLIFDNIWIKRKLVFKSLDASNKMFKHLVTFKLKEERIDGVIVFENANLFFIDELEEIKRLAKIETKRVVFGQGCDRYRVRIERTIPMDRRWSFLLQEMAETFVIFCDWQCPTPIQVNVECEYGADNITIRYFADCALSQHEFEIALKEKVPGFVALIKDPSEFLKEAVQKTTLTDKLITAFDFYRRAVSLKLGLTPRVKFDPSWTSKQTAELLQAIGLDDSKVVVEVHNHFKQSDFFTIGTRKFTAGGNLTMGGEADSV